MQNVKFGSKYNKKMVQIKIKLILRLIGFLLFLSLLMLFVVAIFQDQVVFFIFIVIIGSFICISIFYLLLIRHQFKKYMNKFKNINGKKDDYFKEIELLKKEVTSKFTNGTLSILNHNKILYTIDLEIERRKISELDFFSTVDKLITSYESMIPIIKTDVDTLIKQTDKKLEKRIPIYNNLLKYENTGDFAIFLFYRRTNEYIRIISSTVGLLEFLCIKPFNLSDESIKKANDNIKKLEKKITELYNETINKRIQIIIKLIGLSISSLISILSLIFRNDLTKYFSDIGIYFNFLIPNVVKFFEEMNPIYQNVIILIIAIISSFFLSGMIYQTFFTQRAWYNKIIRISRVQIFEERVLSHLEEIQKEIKKDYYKENYQF